MMRKILNHALELIRQFQRAHLDKVFSTAMQFEFALFCFNRGRIGWLVIDDSLKRCLKKIMLIMLRSKHMDMPHPMDVQWGTKFQIFLITLAVGLYQRNPILFVSTKMQIILRNNVYPNKIEWEVYVILKLIENI